MLMPGDGLAAGPVPPEFICPISTKLMTDPVCTADGQTYEKAEISKWLAIRPVSPVTNLRLRDLRLTPNVSLRSLIESYLNRQSKRECKAQERQALIAKVDRLTKDREAAEGKTQSRK